MQAAKVPDPPHQGFQQRYSEQSLGRGPQDPRRHFWPTAASDYQYDRRVWTAEGIPQEAPSGREAVLPDDQGTGIPLRGGRGLSPTATAVPEEALHLSGP